MKSMERYFIQFWAVTNPVILTYDDLRKELYRIWCEIYNAVPICEKKLLIVGNMFRERVLKGAAKNREENKNNTQQTKVDIQESLF